MASDSQENTATRWFKARLNSPAYLAAQQKSNHSVEEYPSLKIGPGHETTPFLPIQQSDEMKPLLLDIGRYGLLYAYEKNRPHNNPADLDNYKCKKTKLQSAKTVIIVGGGPAGLSAAYELKRAGHRVVILEKQHRVGGRVKTIGDSHFYKGMWSDCKYNAIKTD